MKVSSCITMINSASLTPWLIQVKNFLTTQESPFLSLQLNLFLTCNVSRSQIMSSKHSLAQQDPSHTGHNKQLKEETRSGVQMYTSLGPMMRMNTKPSPLMTIKSFSKRMLAVSLLNPCATHCSRATSKDHPHPTLRRSSFPNLSWKSSPKINNK